ncbi:hypothetical protein Agub_g6324, partial [Astrephomene gubernaculifera]
MASDASSPSFGCNLLQLPKELLSVVLSRLSWRDALRASATCHCLHDLVFSQNSCLWTHTLRLPISALPGPAISTLLLPQLHTLTITAGNDKDDAVRPSSDAAALILHAWLERLLPHHPPPAAAPGHPSPLCNSGDANTSPATPAAIPSATPAAAPLPPPAALPGPPLPAAAPLCNLRELQLHLDVLPASALLLLRLAPQLSRLSCLCLHAGAHNGAPQQQQQQQRQVEGQQKQQRQQLLQQRTQQCGQVKRETQQSPPPPQQQQQQMEEQKRDGIDHPAHQQHQQQHQQDLFSRLSQQLSSLSLSCPACLDALFSHLLSTTTGPQPPLPPPRLTHLSAAPHPAVTGALAAAAVHAALPRAHQARAAAAAASAAASRQSHLVVTALGKAAYLARLQHPPPPAPPPSAAAAAGGEEGEEEEEGRGDCSASSSESSDSPHDHPQQGQQSPPASPSPALLIPPAPSPSRLLLTCLELRGVRLSPSLARSALPCLPHLRSLSLAHVSVAPSHPAGWDWLGDCSALTRLALLPGCPLTPARLGLAHPALSRLTGLQQLEAPAWGLPREAPANLAPLTRLTRLVAAAASSLPYVVPQPLPYVQVFGCAGFLGGTPLGGHLAALMPALTELRALDPTEYDSLDLVAAAVAGSGFGIGVGNGFVTGIGIGGGALLKRGGRRGTAAAAVHAPGPTASSARSRVAAAVLPLDVHSCVRLHTFGSLRRLELVGGRAGALGQVLAPLRGLTSLTLRWASLPDSDDEDEDEEEEEEEEEEGPLPLALRVSSSKSSWRPTAAAAAAAGGGGAGGSFGNGRCGDSSDSSTSSGNNSERSISSDSDSATSGSTDRTDGQAAQQQPQQGGGGRTPAPSPCPSSPTPAVTWARRLAGRLPALSELVLEHVAGLEGAEGHDVLE